MTFLRVAVFSLVIVLAYTAFTNVVPQVQSDPPEEEEIDTGALDRAGQIAWGERLFTGKGTCTLCHNDLGRAPNFLALDLASIFPARIADARYDGAAKGKDGAGAIEAYARESLLEPSAYVVAGFGKKGSGDTVSPMRNVSAAPISLSKPEIDALIAFFQDRAGVDVTVPLPSAEVAAVEEAAGDEREPAATAEDAIERYGCAGCHDLGGSGADIGPRLGGVGARLQRDGVRHAILDPNATIADGFEADMMPKDYAEQMRVSELELLIDYLLALPVEAAAQ
ncbi:MAG: c-type cytochrome [Proteobacteria bacterium]|nr:c-type cytochrome [Pseudomonadota bacterium]